MTTHLPAEATASATWRKSSYSGGGGNNCVEVAPLPLNVIAVRDSKDTGRPAIPICRDAWGSLLAALAD